MRLALDATYSVDPRPTGVGVYSLEMLEGLAAAGTGARWLWCYRARQLLASFRRRLPARCSRALLLERWTPRAGLFHGLNQRLPLAPPRPAVATFHDLFVLTGDYSTPEFRRRFAAQARGAAERADRIIAVSEFTAGQVHELLGVEWERIRVVRHGVRLPEPPPPARPREPIVLSVGAIQRRKNTRRLVEAFERMPEGWKLVLAGSAGYASQEALARIDSSPRRAAIHVAGYVDAAALQRLYATASIFAFPSLDEGFGMPVLEAMARGLPVLASNRSALPEVAGDAAYLVDPGEVEEIAEGLCRIASDPQLRASLSARGVERARRFRWEEAVEKTWGVYRELLG